MKRAFSFFLALGFGLTLAALADEPAIKAPTRLYPEPNLYLLLRLPGDQAHVRYTPGSLDRAANLQTRLEMSARIFNRWTNIKLELLAYVLTREEWQKAQISVAYGVPVRVGRLAFAAPAFGDDGTVRLWASQLHGVLPTVAGMPLRGTPQEAATMAMADVVTQIEVGEALVDEAGLAGDAYWVRGLTAQVVALSLSERLEPGRLRDLEAMYRQIAAERDKKPLSARDYQPDMSLDDWLWFQAQFFTGARIIVDKEGHNDAVKKLLKLSKKRGGLSGDLLLRHYKGLHEWFYDRFSAVSFEPSR